MWKAVAVTLIAGMAAVAARHVLYPPAGAPAASRLFAVAGFAFLVLALVAVLWEGHRRRRGASRPGVGQSLFDPKNRRETFRIPYPEGERPTLHLSVSGTPQGLPPGVTLEVLNLSEEGACVRLPNEAEAGGRVEGEIRLTGGQSVAIAGRVACCTAATAHLEFAEALPGRLLFDEQRRLRGYFQPASST